MGLKAQTTRQGRTTLLDAVNICLENIGEQAVDQLDDEQIQDARTAQRTCLEIHKEGQTRGWSWNTEYSYPFKKDSSSKEIVVPENAVEWAPSAYQYNGRFQLRGDRVYDLLNRTYTFDDTVDEICADVIWLLSWDEVPEAFNRWVTIRAARIFSDRALGSEALFKYTSKDEADAKSELERVEMQQENPNMLTGPWAFPTYQPNQGLMNRRVSNGYSIY